MSDNSTQRMIEMYLEEAGAPMFLSGFYQTPARNIHNTEKVEIDVVRDDEDIATVIQDVSVGPRSNEATLYTNKGFTPPIYDEKGPVTAFNLMKRQPGANPFDDPDFGANATFQAFTIWRKLERKIRRAVELMASQVFQSATLNLTDQAGTVLYNLDFQGKTLHFPIAGTTAGYGAAWAADGTAGSPLEDLEVLAIAVRRDGKVVPNKLVMGRLAMQSFLNNASVQTKLDNRRMELGQVAPETRGQGATFMGRVWIGQYLFELWMYDGFYRDPVTGNHTPYVDDRKIIMLADGARLDLTFGSIPSFVAPESRALPFLPPRIVSEDLGIVLSTNSWVTDDGKTLFVSAGTRPLTIPTAIDTFGCLDTAIP